MYLNPCKSRVKQAPLFEMQVSVLMVRVSGLRFSELFQYHQILSPQTCPAISSIKCDSLPEATRATYWLKTQNKTNKQTRIGFWVIYTFPNKDCPNACFAFFFFPVCFSVRVCNRQFTNSRYMELLQITPLRWERGKAFRMGDRKKLILCYKNQQ